MKPLIWVKRIESLARRQLAGLLGVLALLAAVIVYARLPIRAPSTYLLAGWHDREDAIFVKITDSQKRAGIYSQSPQTNLRELLAAAGYENLTAIAATTLRRRLVGGESIFLQMGKDNQPLSTQIGKMDAAERFALGLCLDINRASEADLIMLRGIGEKTAQAIMGLRRERGGLASVDELLEVRGINNKRLAILREQVCVEK